MNRSMFGEIGRVSVIIPHLDDYDRLDACLALLEAQSFPRARTEIIVADNGSSRGIDAVRAMVGSRARVIEAHERGAGPARNEGVRASTGDALAFLDSDCRPDSRWLEEGLAELQHAHFVGGRVDVLTRDPSQMTAAEAFESVFAFHNDRYVQSLGFTVTASMFVWRPVFEAVGGFDKGVPEDLDWCARAARKKYVIGYAAKSIVGHPARRTMPELKSKWRRLTLESFAASRRDEKAKLSFLLRQWAALLAIGPHAVKVMTSARLKGAGNRLKAIGALAEIRIYRLLVAHQAFQASRAAGAPSPSPEPAPRWEPPEPAAVLDESPGSSV